MVMVMPGLIAPVKKEVSFLLAYSRSRPRFKLHLAIDAILSVALVLAIFQVATFSSRQNRSEALKISGAVALSAGDLVKYVKKENLVAYWAGPNSADKYTLIATTPGEVTISYYPKDADIASVGTSLLVVQTHKHFSTSEAQAYSEGDSGPGSFLMNQGAEGNAIQYNPATPTKVIVTFKKQFAAVTIYSEVPEASLTLAMKPGAIQKVA